jgi:hypothetical protein
MIIDLNNFLHSLAIFMVTNAAAQTPAVTLKYTQTNVPRDLWRNQVVEKDPNNSSVQGAADPYSVLAITGGPPTGNDPVERLSIQCMTRATAVAGQDEAMGRAKCLYETLLDVNPSSGAFLQPLRNFVIDGANVDGTLSDQQYKAISVEMRSRPGKIGTDDRGRAMVSFNFEIAFTAQTVEI